MVDQSGGGGGGVCRQLDPVDQSVSSIIHLINDYSVDK